MTLMERIDRYRKAIVAFLVPFIASTTALVADLGFDVTSPTYLKVLGYATALLTALGVGVAANSPPAAGLPPSRAEPQSHPPPQ